MLQLVIANILVSLIFYLLFDRISKRINIYDYPSDRKIHQKKTSLLGGIYIFSTFTLYIVSLFFFFPENLTLFFNYTYQFLIFIFISLCFFIIGLIDDKRNISANKKIVLFIFFIIILLNSDQDLLIKVLYFSFTDFIILTLDLSTYFTFLCIFLFINALNMYDGSDLQLGNYILIFTCYLIFKSGFTVLYFFILPITIFLVLNFLNRTFIGNSGAYYLGFFLSYVIIKIYNLQSILYSDEIVLLMFYPVVDLIRLFFIRLINDKNPFLGDRLHIHHILLKLFSKNLYAQFFLILLVIFPLLIYEILNINIIYCFIFNSLIYSIILFKYYRKVTINNE